jgi:hypothetical protein
MTLLESIIGTDTLKDFPSPNNLIANSVTSLSIYTKMTRARLLTLGLLCNCNAGPVAHSSEVTFLTMLLRVVYFTTLLSSSGCIASVVG